jgi:hypothetical protein
VVQLKDPRYAANIVYTVRGHAEAPPVTAAIGTSISGKVVRQDGKAIDAEIQVNAVNSGPNGSTPIPTKVAADGTYTITGIAPGSYTVSASTSTKNGALLEWVDPMPVKVTATIEAPGAAPDLVLTTGGIVTGSVLDADTKKPLAYVGIIIQGTVHPDYARTVNLRTGADGKFAARVWIGKVDVTTFNEPDDYICNTYLQKLTVTTVPDQALTLDPIFLKRAPPVSGTAVDDSGKPVPNVVLQTQEYGNGSGITFPAVTTNENGDFSIHHMIPGSFWFDAGVDWSVVSPTTFTVPLTSPIKLVLKKNATADILGTVIDTTNAPVAGVEVSFNLSHDTIIGYQIGNQVTVTTGSDGVYTVPNAPADSSKVRRATVTKNGYVLKGGGDVSASNGKVIVSPIVMAQLGGKVIGTVYNGLGKPVADAWVSCPDSGKDAVPVQTDASGHFELTNIAVGTVNLYAAKGLFFSQSTLQSSVTPAKRSVRLPAVPTAPIGPPNLSKATALLTQNINSQTAMKDHENEREMRDQAAHIIAEASPNAAVSFILSTSSISTWDLAQIVSARTDSDPLGIASWALLPIKRMSDNNGRANVAASIGLAVAPYDAAAAAPYYDIATQYIHFDHLDQGSIMDATSLTALAYILNRPEADGDYAKVSAAYAELIKKSKTDPGMAYIADWLPNNLAKIIALGNVDKAIAMISAQSSSNRYDNVPGIIPELVKPAPASAMKLYRWVAKETESANPPWIRESALCFVLPIIYKTDPRGAIAQAHAITDADTQAVALTDLADIMPIAEADPLYLEAQEKGTGQNGNGYSPACIANHAWQRDQVLGRQLFKTAFTKFVANTAKSHQMYDPKPSYSDFAYYYSRIDPGYCRILLESQFAKNNGDASQYYGGDSAEADVAAMCAIDINRAVEMAGKIKVGYASYGAGLKPAQYLLLTPQQRGAIPFSQWVNNSDWVPGTPSN